MSTLKVNTVQHNTSGFNNVVQFTDGAGTQNGTLCRAWVNFNGTSTVAIRAQFNVSSITDNGTGDYTVNFSNAMTDANFGFSTAGDRGGGAAETRSNQLSWVAQKDRGTGYIRLTTGGSTTTPGISAPEDQTHVSVTVFR